MYLGFEAMGCYYVYTALTCGLAIAPYVFTKAIKVFAAFLHINWAFFESHLHYFGFFKMDFMYFCSY